MPNKRLLRTNSNSPTSFHRTGRRRQVFAILPNSELILEYNPENIKIIRQWPPLGGTGWSMHVCIHWYTWVWYVDAYRCTFVPSQRGTFRIRLIKKAWNKMQLKAAKDRMPGRMRGKRRSKIHHWGQEEKQTGSAIGQLRQARSWSLGLFSFVFSPRIAGRQRFATIVGSGFSVRQSSPSIPSQAWWRTSFPSGDSCPVAASRFSTSARSPVL